VSRTAFQKGVIHTSVPLRFGQESAFDPVSGRVVSKDGDNIGRQEFFLVSIETDRRCPSPEKEDLSRFYGNDGSSE